MSAFALAASIIGTAGDAHGRGPAFAADRILVGLRSPEGSSSAGLQRLHERVGARGARPLFAAASAGSPHRWSAGVHMIELAPGADVWSAVRAYAADPNCAWAQPDFEMSAQLLPDDPFLHSSGSWGQAEQDLWGLHRMRVPEAWDVTLGEGVLVGVVDSGLDFDHPDIAQNVFLNRGEDLNGNGRVDPEDFNGIDDDENGYIDDLRGFDFVNSVDGNGDGDFDDPEDAIDSEPRDDNSHGTHVAGTIAAVADNGFGIAGVAPRATLLPVKGLAASNLGFLSDLLLGLVYAAEMGADVINNSWGCSQRCPSQPAIEEAVRAATAMGAVVLFAAGNQTDDVAFYSPQNMQETITVAASAPDDTAVRFSNFGVAIDVSAPGGGFPVPPPSFQPIRNILSVHAGQPPIGDSRLAVDERFLRQGGTSMAVAHVSGLAALVRSRWPGLPPGDVKRLLRMTALDTAPPGRDAASGFGRADAAAALALDPLPDARVELSAPAARAQLSQRDTPIEILGAVDGADVREWTLLLGSGSSPDVWTPIAPARTEPTRGLLLDWDVFGQADGSYVLRLAATTRDGRPVEQAVSFVLENRVPVQVSESAADSFNPAVFGDRIAWWDFFPPLGGTVFLADLARGLSIPLSSLQHTALLPSIHDDRVVWTESGNGFGVETCTYDPVAGSCERERIAFGPFDFEPVVSGGSTIAWTRVNAAPGFIATCTLDPDNGACAAQRVTFDSGGQIAPALDGSRLVWVQNNGSHHLIRVCDLDPQSGACPPRTVSTSADLFPTEPSVSGDLIVFTGEAGLCVYDAESGLCAQIPTPRLIEPAVFGDRVVWVDQSREPSQLSLCEFDPVRHVCPPQPFGAGAGDRASPNLRGTRLAWSEKRGVEPSQVYFADLHSLSPIGDRRVRSGELLQVPVSASDPDRGPLALSAVQSDGAPLAGIGASFRDLGDGAGRLDWRPGAEQTGRYAITISARDAGGIDTYETIWVDVLAPNRAPVASVVSPVHVRADEAELDACASSDPDGDALVFRWVDAAGAAVGSGCRVLVSLSRTGTGPSFFHVGVDDGSSITEARALVVRLPSTPKARGPKR